MRRWIGELDIRQAFARRLDEVLMGCKLALLTSYEPNSLKSFDKSAHSIV